MYRIEEDILLRVIQDIEPSSAEPVWKIVCTELDGETIAELVQEHWLWKSSAQKDESHCSPRLSELIQQARARHSEIVRRKGLIDVYLVAKEVRCEDWRLCIQLGRAVEGAVH